MEKAVKYVIRGEISVETLAVDEAIGRLKGCVNALRDEHATAELQVNIPRLTRVKVEV